MGTEVALWRRRPPQATGTGAQMGRAASPFVVGDALRAAEMLGEEVQLLQGGLVGQLLLGGARGLGEAMEGSWGETRPRRRRE